MNPDRRILGIDFGLKRIGVAISDPLNIIARGLCVVINAKDCVKDIKDIVQKHEVKAIVIGIPLKLGGDKGKLAEEAEAFAQILEEEILLPVIRNDERFTTTIAHQTLRSMNTPRRERQNKGLVDMMSAALILQSYLDKINSTRNR